MGIVTNAFIDFFIASQLRWTPVGTNHDIYDNRLTRKDPWPEYNYVPRRIYFYYLSFDSDNAPTVEHYLYNNKDAAGNWLPIAEADLENLVISLVRNARGPKTHPQPHGANFQNIIWKHKSYIVLLIDEEGWNFHKRTPNQTAAAFNLTKGSMPNHSFFDGIDLLPTIDGSTRSAVAFINHMKKDEDGNDLQLGDEQKYFFDVFVDVRYKGSFDWLPMILDPGGTNQGPPELP